MAWKCDEGVYGAQRYVGVWRTEQTSQQQRQRKATERLRRVRLQVSDTHGRYLVRGSYLSWRKAWLVAAFYESLPRRRESKVVRAWSHVAKLVSNMRQTRCNRLQATRRRSVKSAVVARWSRHAVVMRHNARLADRLLFSCKRRERDRLLSSAMSAFSLCLLACEGGAR